MAESVTIGAYAVAYFARRRITALGPDPWRAIGLIIRQTGDDGRCVFVTPDECEERDRRPTYLKLLSVRHLHTFLRETKSKKLTTKWFRVPFKMQNPKKKTAPPPYSSR
ncbi:hypothetical protein EVAR_45778_1 [Eumeta japonica]|uniref:Uncharacterized protein n=1 Tax=Eumeta variegata TaxID=151549 RepID=A0A4C1X1I4_EUMVA|nr:hypothetical protein EVAR_45778_1 [Eumeta japonica]